MLTFSPSSRKLSGYTRWWVVLLPTSASKPTVGALFILGGEENEARGKDAGGGVTWVVPTGELLCSLGLGFPI